MVRRRSNLRDVKLSLQKIRSRGIARKTAVQSTEYWYVLMFTLEDFQMGRRQVTSFSAYICR